MFTISTTDFEQAIRFMDMTILLIVIKIAIIYSCLLFLKNMTDCIVGYLLFRSNPHVSIGTKVKVNDFVGYISRVNLSYITVSNKSMIYMIKVSNWKSKDWFFYKTYKIEEKK